MKRITVFLITILFLFLFLAQSIFAQKPTKTTIIAKDEIIDSDLLKTAEALIVSGKVNGDAYLAGSTVTFDGEVTGDLFAFGGVIKINGKIGQDLRVVGGQVIIDSQIGRNLAVAGGTVDISKNTFIPGSLLAVSGNFETKAPVALGAKMVFDRGVINTFFGKDVKIFCGEELIFGPDTKIGGNLTYRGLKEADFQKGATVSGETKFIPQTAPDKELALPLLNQAKFQKGLKKAILPFKVVNLLITFIIGLVLLKIFPHFFINTSNLLKEKLPSSLGWGLLIILLFPITFILLILTLIGIPIALFVILLFTLTLFLAKLVGSFCLGRWLIKKLTQDERRGWAMLTGLLVSSLMKVIPYLGWLFILGLVTASLGAIALHFKAPSPLSPPKRSPK